MRGADGGGGEDGEGVKAERGEAAGGEPPRDTSVTPPDF